MGVMGAVVVMMMMMMMMMVMVMVMHFFRSLYRRFTLCPSS
jgi:hypothetical protein